MKDKTYRVFFLLIPVGAVLLAIVINILFNYYHEYVFKKDNREILKYLMSKDIETEAEYKELAEQLFKEKKYDDYSNVSIILGEDYLVMLNYHTFNDLKSFLNIFDIKWVDDSGYIDDKEINTKMEKKSAIVFSKYIARLNEYKEVVIEEFKDDENEWFLKEQEKHAQEALAK